jgi:GNAT superfamily N-acetyltransferase
MVTGSSLFEDIARMFSSGDVSKAGDLFAEDYVDHQRPDGWDLAGPAEFVTIVRHARAGMRNLSVEVNDCLVDERRVAARLTWRYQDEDGSATVRETLEMLRVANGRVAEHWGGESAAPRRESGQVGLPPVHRLSRVEIRPITEDDRDFVVEMARQACVIEDRPLPPADAPEVVEILPTADDEAILATASDGSRVGAAWWHFHDPVLLRSDDGSAVPEMIIAVESDLRGRGIGTALINALAERGASSFPALSLNVHLRNPAARLYTRAGFRVAGRGRGWFGVAMERRLTDQVR